MISRWLRTKPLKNKYKRATITAVHIDIGDNHEEDQYI